jgi:hypothetical protein
VQDGRTVEQTREVKVRANDLSTVKFTLLAN